MLRRLLFALLGLVLGYLCGLFGGLGLFPLLSDNHFDRGVESAMTSAFVIGPLIALIGAGIGFWKGGRRMKTAD